MKKILHVLEHSFPRLSGYTIRSKYIAENQLRQGLHPVVVTSPLQGKTQRSLHDYEKVDSIRCYRTGTFNNLNMEEPLPLRLLRRYAYSRSYSRAIKWVAKKESVDIIHSHSSYLNGVRGNEVARKLALPSVYEVRGLWQDTAAALIDEINTSHWKYRFIDLMERRATFGADRVVTISEHLRDELNRKGVKKSRLVVVPNGVDTELFTPKEKKSEVIRQYGLENKLVFGFIGSIRRIEGLSLFLENLHKLVSKTRNIFFLVIGDGEELNHLKKITASRELQEYVTFAGRISHDRILDYYSAVDIFLYPRIDAKVNHMVTPLKPLEAMAMEKAVIASDVGGLRELIEDEKTGLLFRAQDGDHLIKRCLDLIDNHLFVKTLGKRARAWTVEERDWSHIGKLYNNLYSELLNSKQKLDRQR